MGDSSLLIPSKENISTLLANDHKVKVAGVDCDGVLRGKIMDKEKFLSSISQGFGFSSAVFGWDMHDVLYDVDTSITSAKEGYPDLIAIPDVESFRRIPWEDNIPFFLLRFEVKNAPVAADGRGILRSMCEEIDQAGLKSLAGGMQSPLGRLGVVRN